MNALKGVLGWLEHRGGVQSAARHVLDERLPAGTGWWHTLGSALLLLLAAQAATGVVLALYYVPAPDHAWDSVRFIVDRVTFGRVVRNLHFFGASFVVVAAGAHLLRSFVFGAYKAPRELTWTTGVLLLLVIMGFALTGYLLPWDQRAYWATVVTLNIARSAPLLGELAAQVMRGGQELGALTLSRWFAAHVILLPGALAGLVGLHLVLMRRHRVSGPITPSDGPEPAFYPDHAAKDATVAGLVFAVLLTFAVVGNAPLEPVADPSDASYAPRPEWYFLWLFQLLKYFPGRLEVLGAHGVPALLVGLLLLLPFLDRRPERRPWRRPVAMTAALAVVLLVGSLTVLGLRDVPPADVETRVWGAQAIGGAEIASRDACVRCHRDGGAAPAFDTMRVRRDAGWIEAHAADPEAIAPGARTPPPGLSLQERRAVAAWARAVRSAVPAPAHDEADRRALAVIGTQCLGCHVLDGDGRGDAPNLSRAGKERDAAWLAAWITDPTAFEYDTDMPAFGNKLSREQIESVARHLARRR